MIRCGELPSGNVRRESGTTSCRIVPQQRRDTMKQVGPESARQASITFLPSSAEETRIGYAQRSHRRPLAVVSHSG